MRGVIRRGWILAAIALCAAPVLAHHSYGMFDRTKELPLKGTVVEFEWTNPHSWIHVAVPDDKGVAQTWNVEMGPPGQLARTGWKRKSFKPGDKIDLTINPLKDGTPGGHLLTAKGEDGVVLYDVVFKTPPSAAASGDAASGGK